MKPFKPQFFSSPCRAGPARVREPTAATRPLGLVAAFHLKLKFLYCLFEKNDLL